MSTQHIAQEPCFVFIVLFKFIYIFSLTTVFLFLSFMGLTVDRSVEVRKTEYS